MSYLRRGFLAACALLFAAGCSQDSINLQSPEEDLDLLETSVKLIGDYAIAEGVQPMTINGIALVTQLDGTGSDPQPSEMRNLLVSEMQKRGVAQPNQILASSGTAMVQVTAFLRPGIRKGDHFDIAVEAMPGDATTSLRGGWLMETRLSEMFVSREGLRDQIRGGDLLALAQGWILVDPTAEEDEDSEAPRRGRVLGGGVALKSRELGLFLREEKTARNSDAIGKAINRRFSTHKQGVQEGVATPRTSGYVDLVIHPRYKDNIARYIAVVRAIPLRETTVERTTRLRLLERQLLDPITSSRAAIQLEAIGKEGEDILRRGLASRSLEVRFYSAEALAYLDVAEAAPHLAEIAHQEPAFRAYAFTALSAMKDVSAYEQLRKLLDVTSAETRYGAFRALWTWDPDDALVRGEGLGGKFSYHHLTGLGGPPMIHLTGGFRPEIVLFGRDHRMIAPVKLQAGKKVDVIVDSDDHVTVSKYVTNKPIERRVVTNDVNRIIRAVTELGGDYGDVVQMLREAKSKKALTSRLEVDALPRTDRAFHRDQPAEANAEGEEIAAGGDRKGVASPAPELFTSAPTSKGSPSQAAKREDDPSLAGEAGEKTAK